MTELKPKPEPVPSPEEVDDWIYRLESGEATTGFIDRLVRGYKKLYRARPADELPTLSPIVRRARKK